MTVEFPMGDDAEPDRADPLGRHTRREVLQYGAVAGAAVALPGLLDARHGSLPVHLAASSLKTFSASQAQTVEALVERLVPSDASGGGASEAGVLRYIDRALAGDYAALAPLYANNVKALDAYATMRFGNSFTGLSASEQDAVIGAMEQGSATGFVPDAATFFMLVREHTLEGMFGDPYYGGNQNFVGWKVLSYPGLRANLPAAHQRLDVTVPASFRSVASLGLFKMIPNVGPVG